MWIVGTDLGIMTNSETEAAQVEGEQTGPVTLASTSGPRRVL